MIEEQLISYLIKDILSSEEYTLSGIAYYTNTPEEVVYEVASGTNKNPSLRLARKIVELHRTIKPEFYSQLINRIYSGVEVARRE